MKTPSGTFAFIIIAVAAAALIPIFRSVASKPGDPREDQKLTLKIGRGENDFVDVNQSAFDEALRDVQNHGGNYQIRFKADANASVTPSYTPPPKLSLKTDQVTTSELAKNAPPGDPNVTRRVTCNAIEDIKKVLDALITPTPTPTPSPTPP